MLAFVHIPKTAGTTLHKIICHQYPANRIAIHHDTDGPPTPELVACLRKRDCRVVMGHFSVGLHEFIPGLRYITCLRHPVARLVSHYHHTLNTPAHYLHHAVTSGKMDLADYVSSGLSGELTNGMTRMLAGVADFHHAIVDDQTLALAKSNIENLFDGVILNEFFDAGLLMLAESLDWKRPYYLRRKVGRYPAHSRKPDHRELAVIEQQNRFDCELHAWATERFTSRSAAIPDLVSRLVRFRRRNAAMGKLVFCLRELQSRARI